MKILRTGLLLSAILLSHGTAAYTKPNLIVILADDIGASELGCYGHPTHRTPNLDRLASTGVQFETFLTSPVCHPTRFTIMTGQYGFRTGVLNFGGKRAGPPPGVGGPDSIATHLTFAQLLKPAGYATAIAGKWQLSGRQPSLIYETGFDEYCVWGYRNYFKDAEREKAEQAGIDFRSRYWHPSVCENGDWVPTDESDYGPGIFTDFVTDFIRNQRDKPFFIYYPMVHTHGPWLPTPDSFKDGMDKEKSSKTHFAANVEYMDKLVGKIVDALDATGVRDNTVIFFTGDNGTGGDGKSTATERGARVPLIVNSPSLIKPRGKTLQLGDMSDIFPTLMNFAGTSIPAEHTVDGKSLESFLRGATESTRDWVFAYQADFRILRTERWLLEENSPRHFGRLFDCGTYRNGNGYRDVTQSTAPDVLEAKATFEKLLETLPAPYLETDGKPNDPVEASSKKDTREIKKAKKADKNK